MDLRTCTFDRKAQQRGLSYFFFGTLLVLNDSFYMPMSVTTPKAPYKYNTLLKKVLNLRS